VWLEYSQHEFLPFQKEPIFDKAELYLIIFHILSVFLTVITSTCRFIKLLTVKICGLYYKRIMIVNDASRVTLQIVA